MAIQNTAAHQYHGPQSGEVVSSPAGSALLSMCEHTDMFFLNGRSHSPQLPTFHTRVSSSIIDLIIGCKSTLSWSASAETTPYTNVDVQACITDHTLLLIKARICKGNHKPKLKPYIRWRLGDLQDTEKLKAYNAALQRRAHILYNVTTPALAAPRPTQAMVDEATNALVTLINDSAMEAVGKKRIAPGKTKPWMTTKLRQSLDHHRNAHKRWLQNKSESNSAALHAADELAKRALRLARRQHKRIVANRLNRDWAETPSEHVLRIISLTRLCHPVNLSDTDQVL